MASATSIKTFEFNFHDVVYHVIEAFLDLAPGLKQFSVVDLPGIKFENKG